MKNNFLILIALLACGQLFAQDLYFQKQDFISKINNKTATLSPQEQKEQAILLTSKIYIEYAQEPSTGKINEYYGLMRRFRINEAGAIDTYNKIILPISSKSDLLALKVRSISPKGLVKELGEESIKETEEEGRSYKMIAVEGVEEGSEIEFYYLVKTPVTVFGSEKIHNSIPIRQTEFMIISPEYLKFEAKLYNSNSIRQDTLIDKKAYISFKIQNLLPLYEEKYANDEANKAQVEYKLAYNTANGNAKIFSWKDAGNTFFELMHKTTKESAKEIEKVLKKENIGGVSEEKSIRGIENYIKSNISIKEDANNGSLPDEILKSKFANEGAIARLYVQFFEAANVNYELIVGVSRFKKRFDKSFETWNFMDKYYFYFPNTKKYIDPNNPLARYGQISLPMEGTDALFISNITIGEMKTALAKVKAIPFSTSSLNYDNINAEISFPKNLDGVNIKMKRTFAGHQASDMKGYFMLSNDEQRSKILENILKATLKEDAVFSNSVAQNYNLNSEEADKDFIITTDISTKSMLEKAGNKYFFKLGDIIGPQAELYNERPRQQAIDISNAHSYLRKIKINIPENYKIRGLEGIKRDVSFEYNGKKAMGFVADYQIEGQVLNVTIEEYYNEVLLPISVYDNFQKVINAAADFNKLTLVFE
jgi:hypothetical protein